MQYSTVIIWGQVMFPMEFLHMFSYLFTILYSFFT